MRKGLEIAFAAALIAAASLYAIIFHFPAPYYDQWDLAAMFEAADAGTLRWQDLFAVHGGHWHASAYVILIPLAQLTHWSHLAEAIATIVTIAAIAAVLARMGIAFAKRAAPGVQTGLFWLAAVFLAFGLDQSANLTWNFCFSTYLGLLGAIVCLAALTEDKFTAAHFAASQLAFAIGVTSHAAAFAALPVGLVLILLRDDASVTRRALFGALWIAIAIAWSVSFYSSSRHSPFGDYGLAADMGKAGFWSYLAMFEIKFLGSAIARLTQSLIIPIAALGPIVALASAYFLKQRGASLRTLAAPLALCAFGFGAGLACGLGRFEFGPDMGANGRYATFSAIFWLGVVWLMLAAASYVQSKTWRTSIMATLAVCALLKFASGIQSAEKTARLTPPVAIIAEEMRAHPRRAARAAREISWPRQDIRRHVAFIQRKHWSVYAQSPARD